jgi:hypothetical protein
MQPGFVPTAHVTIRKHDTAAGGESKSETHFGYHGPKGRGTASDVEATAQSGAVVEAVVSMPARNFKEGLQPIPCCLKAGSTVPPLSEDDGIGVCDLGHEVCGGHRLVSGPDDLSHQVESVESSDVEDLSHGPEVRVDNDSSPPGSTIAGHRRSSGSHG